MIDEQFESDNNKLNIDHEESNIGLDETRELPSYTQTTIEITSDEDALNNVPMFQNNAKNSIETKFLAHNPITTEDLELFMSRVLEKRKMSIIGFKFLDNILKSFYILKFIDLEEIERINQVIEIWSERPKQIELIFKYLKCVEGMVIKEINSSVPSDYLERIGSI